MHQQRIVYHLPFPPHNDTKETLLSNAFSLMPQGPSPKELALAALCACTAMTVRTFADAMFSSRSRGWEAGSLRRVRVEAEVRPRYN
jgi:hypothetical protein